MYGAVNAVSINRIPVNSGVWEFNFASAALTQAAQIISSAVTNLVDSASALTQEANTFAATSMSTISVSAPISQSAETMISAALNAIVAAGPLGQNQGLSCVLVTPIRQHAFSGSLTRH